MFLLPMNYWPKYSQSGQYYMYWAFKKLNIYSLRSHLITYFLLCTDPALRTQIDWPFFQEHLAVLYVQKQFFVQTCALQSILKIERLCMLCIIELWYVVFCIFYVQEHSGCHRLLVLFIIARFIGNKEIDFILQFDSILQLLGILRILMQLKEGGTWPL